MAGRIESYIHSDSQTQNKGGLLLSVGSQTDFAARTDEFIDFSRQASRLAYAAGAEKWEDVVETFPEIEEKRLELEKSLKEKITIGSISILRIDT